MRAMKFRPAPGTCTCTGFTEGGASVHDAPLIRHTNDLTWHQALVQIESMYMRMPQPHLDLTNQTHGRC